MDALKVIDNKLFNESFDKIFTVNIKSRQNIYLVDFFFSWPIKIFLT